MVLSLRPIDHTNWRDCIALTLPPHQQKFVAPNTISLLEAAYDTGTQQPYGIYLTDEMIGFLMFESTLEDGQWVWYIARLMIITEHQNKGYGGQAIGLALDLMRNDPLNAPTVEISFHPDNHAARHLYTKLGFQPAGKMPDSNEDLMRLTL